MKELTDLVEKLVTEKTFNLDAAVAVENLHKKFERAEQEIARLKKAFEDVTANWREEVELRGKRDDEIRALKQEIASYKANEEKARTSIAEAALQAGIAAAYKDAFHIVFKPNAVRETIHRNIPVAIPGSNGCSGYVNMSTETEASERTEG
jgi:regulator of replication initiation timing